MGPVGSMGSVPRVQWLQNGSDRVSESSRRNFLLGKMAAGEPGEPVAPGPIFEHVAPVESAADHSSADHYLLHVARSAMACEFQIFLNAGEYENETESALAALDEVDRLESQLSFFRPDSELCRINREAGQGPIAVEPGLFELLRQARQYSQETEGATDITSTPLWELWGFARREGQIPNDAQIAEALKSVGWQSLELDPQARTVRFLKPAMRLNLGSVGKGYALDRCAEKLADDGIHDFLIHGGQSSVLARGAQAVTRGAPPDRADCWMVGIRHPLRPDRRLGEVRLRDRALGTSGSQAQSFWHSGRRYGHILDPRTGRPASHVLSATVVAPSALVADLLSTAFYVMEPESSLEYCRKRPELGIVLVVPARRAGGFEVLSAGLGRRDLSLFMDGRRASE